MRTRRVHCLAPDDKLLEKVVDLAAWHDALLAAPDEYEQMRMLNLGAPTGNLRHGKKTTGPTTAPPTTCAPRSVRSGPW